MMCCIIDTLVLHSCFCQGKWIFDPDCCIGTPLAPFLNPDTYTGSQTIPAMRQTLMENLLRVSSPLDVERISASFKRKLQRQPLGGAKASWHDEFKFAVTRVLFLQTHDLYPRYRFHKMNLDSDTSTLVTISYFDKNILQTATLCRCGYSCTCLCSMVTGSQDIQKRVANSLFVRAIGRVLREFKFLGDVAGLVQVFLWNFPEPSDKSMSSLLQKTRVR